MDREQIISLIKEGIELGKISKDDLRQVLKEDKPVHTYQNLVNVLYIVGAVVVLLGVIIVLWQNWASIGIAVRLLLTLGIGISSYIASLLYMKDSEHERLSSVFLLISAILSIFGVTILFDYAGLYMTNMVSTLTALGFAIVYGYTTFLYRRGIPVLLTIIFASLAYISFVNFLISSTNLDFATRLFAWAIVILGIVYISLTEAFISHFKNIKNILIFFGTVFFLGACIFLSDSYNLELLFLIPLSISYAFSLRFKSKIMLVLSTLFLIGYIVWITNRFFVDSVGWALSLVILGFLIIGLAYGTLQISRKYIGQS